MGRAIGDMEFVRCTEVVHLSERPLLEVSLYYPCHNIILMMNWLIFQFSSLGGGGWGVGVETDFQMLKLMSLRDTFPQLMLHFRLN